MAEVAPAGGSGGTVSSSNEADDTDPSRIGFEGLRGAVAKLVPERGGGIKRFTGGSATVLTGMGDERDFPVP
jgi:hypothetical protein